VSSELQSPFPSTLFDQSTIDMSQILNQIVPSVDIQDVEAQDNQDDIDWLFASADDYFQFPNSTSDFIIADIADGLVV
jgi:hypothetical protein